MAKAPVPGRVKTRLCPPLQPEEAAAFHAASLAATVENFSSFSPVLFYSGDSGWFRQHYPQLERYPQGDGDLGARLEQAFGHLLAGGGVAALIGSDSPDLPVDHVKAAFAALASHEAACIPARDGGYVLIGQRCHDPRLFQKISWSSPQVLEETRTACRAAGVSLAEIGVWEDIDTVADLQRLVLRAGDTAIGRLAGDLLRRYGLTG